MDIERLLKKQREEILRIAANHGARNVRIFGSVARKQADESSDIDFLIDMDPGRSLLDHASLILELEKLLGKKVDIVNRKGIKPRIRKRILQEAIPL